MELAFLTLLLKNGAKSVSGGVAIDYEGVLKTRLAKNRGRANGVDEGLEGGFVFVFPMKFAAFSTESYQGIERSGEHAEVPDVHAVEVEETQECA